MKAANERKWEFIGHGFTQRNMQKVSDEKIDIHMTTEAIRKATGKPPRGWLGPGLTETWETPDLLKRGWLRVRGRLGAGRPAGVAEDADQADRQHPLYPGVQ